MKGNLLSHITVAFFLLTLSFSICLCNVHVLITSGLSLRDLCLESLGTAAATEETANAFIRDGSSGKSSLHESGIEEAGMEVGARGREASERRIPRVSCRPGNV